LAILFNHHRPNSKTRAKEFGSAWRRPIDNSPPPSTPTRCWVRRATRQPKSRKCAQPRSS